MTKPDDEAGFGPWNPGLESSIPADVLPLSTMFAPENVETSFREANELSEFCGLPAFDLVVFKPERLIIHALLIRVTTSLSVPDGPDYEELGINLRGMVSTIYENYAEPKLDKFCDLFEEIRAETKSKLAKDLTELRHTKKPRVEAAKPGWLARVFSRTTVQDTPNEKSFDERLTDLARTVGPHSGEFTQICNKSLLTIINAISSHRGSLLGDDETIIRLAAGLVLNDWASLRLGEALDPIFKSAVKTEGYRALVNQTKPFIMNVKGASASGKSTIRPKQRDLAERMGIAWEDFALISPDYWRKYLLDYQSLGEHAKYGAMLTGHELAIIDKKLDRLMARQAKAEAIPHLLIDRFRFDSFSVGDDQSSQLLTRFGDTAFMFFMITPPEATVDRAYRRGLTTGRYKAVDDLLDHNIEAYSGMPKLFFSWASSTKKVHYEFLDNSVPAGDCPKTVAFGWNDSMTVLDAKKLIDIERYKKINVDATFPDEVFADTLMGARINTGFLSLCTKLIPKMVFADQRTTRIYGRLENGEWVWQDTNYVRQFITDTDVLTGLEVLGWSKGSNSEDQAVEPVFLEDDKSHTLGDWGECS